MRSKRACEFQLRQGCPLDFKVPWLNLKRATLLREGEYNDDGQEVQEDVAAMSQDNCFVNSRLTVLEEQGQTPSRRSPDKYTELTPIICASEGGKLACTAVVTAADRSKHDGAIWLGRWRARTYSEEADMPSTSASAHNRLTSSLVRGTAIEATKATTPAAAAATTIAVTTAVIIGYQRPHMIVELYLAPELFVKFIPRSRLIVRCHLNFADKYIIMTASEGGRFDMPSTSASFVRGTAIATSIALGMAVVTASVAADLAAYSKAVTASAATVTLAGALANAAKLSIEFVVAFIAAPVVLTSSLVLGTAFILPTIAGQARLMIARAPAISLDERSSTAQRIIDSCGLGSVESASAFVGASVLVGLALGAAEIGMMTMATIAISMRFTSD